MMWLLNTRSLELHEFMEQPENLPRYGILSHRWFEYEVTFRDLHQASPSHRPDATLKTTPIQFPTHLPPHLQRSREKIERVCAEARVHSLNYVWIDTCCIDKSSSAELSEAINSMYHWYKHAATCFVYLHDVDYSRDVIFTSGLGDTTTRPDITTSEWFTRGWTLQELLAPKGTVWFYSRTWNRLGDRDSFQAQITARTGIRASHMKSPTSASIAQRMSWAANRHTTRSEDMTYCLLGLLQVNLPLLYGEGQSRAFRRLQEEIIRTSDDETIFAWRGNNDSKLCGLLATNVMLFAESGDIVPYPGPRKPYAMTNKGLNIEFEVTTWSGRKLFHLGVGPLLHQNDCRLARLNCVREAQPNRPLGVILAAEDWQEKFPLTYRIDHQLPEIPIRTSRIKDLIRCGRAGSILDVWPPDQTMPDLKDVWVVQD